MRSALISVSLLLGPCSGRAKSEPLGRTTSSCLLLKGGYEMGTRTCLISSKSSRLTTRRSPTLTGILTDPVFLPNLLALVGLASSSHILPFHFHTASESRLFSRSTASSAARVLTKSPAPTPRTPGRRFSKTCKSSSLSASRPTSPSAPESKAASAPSAPGTAACWRSRRSPWPRSALVPALLLVELAAQPRELDMFAGIGMWPNVLAPHHQMWCDGFRERARAARIQALLAPIERCVYGWEAISPGGPRSTRKLVATERQALSALCLLCCAVPKLRSISLCTSKGFRSKTAQTGLWHARTRARHTTTSIVRRRGLASSLL